MVDTSQRVLFAPKFTVSKWNRHLAAAKLVFGADTPSGLRRMMVNDTMLKWRRYERLAHYASQNGYDVETNPQSSDFLKIKRGDTRFDILGGDAQITVLLARLASGETKDTSTGELKENIATELVGNFLSGKLNPAMSLLFDKFIVQETFKGEDLSDPKVLAKDLVRSLEQQATQYHTD